MKPFIPQLVYFEPEALNYPLGKELYEKFTNMHIDIRETTSHNQVRGIPGDNELQQYRNAKSTLVVGVRRTLKFDTSKPSAEYAIPLATGCMGHCHYCYLQTTLGSKPYIRVYVNLDDIFAQAKAYIDERAPEITRFEAACTSDIVGIDHLTHALKKRLNLLERRNMVGSVLLQNMNMSIICLMQNIMEKHAFVLASIHGMLFKTLNRGRLRLTHG